MREGEFGALHEAQLAVAREHGASSWPRLKHQLDRAAPAHGHALGHLRWVIDRFAGAGDPGWTPPGDDELGDHFAPRFLERLRPPELVAAIVDMADDLARPLTVLDDHLLRCRVRLAGVEIIAGAEPEPPHRLLAVRRTPLGPRIVDPRVRRAPSAIDGEPPPGAVDLAARAVAELGLPGVLLAGASRDGAPWVVAVGWADLEDGRELTPAVRMPAFSATAVVTVGTVLRLAAEGRLHLDDPANDHLRTVRLAEADVTVRDLLSHTSGVAAAADPVAPATRSLHEVAGPVIVGGGDRGVRRFNATGLATLGQLVADLTGEPFASAACRLVLEPLGMGASGFPAVPDEAGHDRCRGYHVGPGGHFEAVEPRVATFAAAGGLWSTAADLVRLGAGWCSLLPPGLAREATRSRDKPSRRSPRRPGLGWMIQAGCGHLVVAGGAVGVCLCLRVDPRRRLGALAVTNRPMPLDDLAAQLIDAGIAPKENDQ